MPDYSNEFGIQLHDQAMQYAKDLENSTNAHMADIYRNKKESGDVWTDRDDQYVDLLRKEASNLASQNKYTGNINYQIQLALGAKAAGAAPQIASGSKEQIAQSYSTPELQQFINSYVPNVSKAGSLKPGQVGGVIPGSKFGVTELAGQTLTTAQKQAQNPNYNPLYDPRSAEYKAGLENLNKPKEPITMPLQQQYTEPKEPTLTAGFQYPKPTVQGSVFKPPTFLGGTGTFQQGNNPNPIAPPPGGIGGSANASTSTTTPNILPQNQAPSLFPPVGVPQGNQQPKIELPDAFKLNQNIAGPNIMQPLSIHGGITMPSVTPGVKPQSFPSMNWSDLLTIAHSR